MPPVRSHRDLMPSMGLEFVYFDLQPPKPEDRARQIKPDRDAVREELRAEWNEELQRLTGVPDASLWYTVGTFPKRVVWKLGYKWAGWPADIPFDNLSSIPNGAPALERLQKLWKSGELRLVRATEDERERALQDPESVMPNARPQPPATLRSFAVYSRTAARLRELSREFPPPPPRPEPIERVLHPLSKLKPVFVRPLDDSGTSCQPSRTRRQRSDINRPRARPVTNKKPKHPKRGPHTALTFVGAASGWQERYVFSDDHLDEHVAVDEDEEVPEEIECADDSVWD